MINSDIDSDVIVVFDENNAEAITESSFETEQITRNVSIGRFEVKRDDGRNIFHAIINAISFRINMPRGTVKALLACLVALVVVIALFSFSSLHSGNPADNDAAASETENTLEYPTEEGGAVNTERPANTDNYVIISSHYRLLLPDVVYDVWEPEDFYAENETFCELEYADNDYTVRSYLLDAGDKELSETVKADLSQFDSMKFLDEEHIEDSFGDILKIRFETKDDQGHFTAVTGYYWYDSDPKICCLEVSSDDWHDDGVEEDVLSYVYKVPSDSSEVPPDTEKAWQDQQKEEAMNSLVEDGMREQYEPEPDPDPLFN